MCIYHSESLREDNCRPGLRVKRGKDWKYGEQDYHEGKPGFGSVITCSSSGDTLTTKVKWDNTHVHSYPVGNFSVYDLLIAHDAGK